MHDGALPCGILFSSKTVVRSCRIGTFEHMAADEQEPKQHGGCACKKLFKKVCHIGELELRGKLQFPSWGGVADAHVGRIFF